MKKNFINSLHKSIRRKYLERMCDEKVLCMHEAKKYGKNYWDGHRRYGYGGYKYIPGRWNKVAKKLIKTYKLKNGSKILDVGCGKGFLLYELKKILPSIKILGLDVSRYAIKNSKKEIKKFLKIFDCKRKLPFKKNNFDLVISLGTIHNFNLLEVERIINEIVRVGKKSYIMVESYRNESELFNLQCWALTCESFFSPLEWKHLLKSNNYNGDYEFIYFK